MPLSFVQSTDVGPLLPSVVDPDPDPYVKK
jgi:hypothetical protein